MRAATVVRYGQSTVRPSFGDLADVEEWNQQSKAADNALDTEKQEVALALATEKIADWQFAAIHWRAAAEEAIRAAKILRSMTPPEDLFQIGASENVRALLKKQADAAEKRAGEHLARRIEALKKGFTGTIKPRGAVGGSRGARGPGLQIDTNAGRGARGGGGGGATTSDLIDSWQSSGRGARGGGFIGRESTAFVAEGADTPPAPMSDTAKVAIGLGTAALVVGGIWYFAG